MATLNLRHSPDVTLERLTVVNSYGADHPRGETLPQRARRPAGRRQRRPPNGSLTRPPAPPASRCASAPCAPSATTR
ncbi:MAG: hypothetical protein EOO56_02280 [Hymenobacter sp.]|nr:MAG: hypothetical protein EOO56_02280 [Hymenobacter sp.]